VSGDTAIDSMCQKLLVQTPADLPFKVAAQKQTRSDLEAALAAAEKALEGLAGQKAALQERLTELQGGGAQRTQAVIDKLKEQQKEAAAELEREQAAMEEVRMCAGTGAAAYGVQALVCDACMCM
jgi:peptidoglycan hydrolase CwlO-like protein